MSHSMLPDFWNVDESVLVNVHSIEMIFKFIFVCRKIEENVEKTFCFLCGTRDVFDQLNNGRHQDKHVGQVEFAVVFNSELGKAFVRRFDKLGPIDFRNIFDIFHYLNLSNVAISINVDFSKFQLKSEENLQQLVNQN